MELICEKTANKTDALRRIVYTGPELCRVTRYGDFYRMIPHEVAAWQVSEVAMELGGHFTTLDFCDHDGVYIANHATVEDFDRDILPHIPILAKVLVMRDEGAGDVIMSVPAVRELRRRIPCAHITYAVKPGNESLLYGISCIDKIVSVHDVDLGEFCPFDLVINFCRSVDVYSIPRNREHRIDSFALMLGLGKLKDRRTEFNIFPDECDQLFDSHTDILSNGQKYIAFVLQAAGWNRTWTLWRIGELIDTFAAALPDYKLIFVDGPRQDWIPKAPNVINKTGRTHSFKEAALLCSACALTITPDTGIAHALGALGKPTLVLAGSIPPEKRFNTYPKHEWIYAGGQVPCSPCWDFQERYKRDDPRPAGHQNYKSCANDIEVHCMNWITPEMIAAKAKKMLGAK